MFGGQHRIDELTRDERSRLDREKNSTIAAASSAKTKGVAVDVRKRILVKDEALLRPSAIVASRPRSVKGLAMNGPTKIVGPPLTPLPARKTRGVS